MGVQDCGFCKQNTKGICSIHKGRCAENWLWHFAIRLCEVSAAVDSVADQITSLELSNNRKGDSIDYANQRSILREWTKFSHSVIGDASRILEIDIEAAFNAAGQDAANEKGAADV